PPCSTAVRRGQECSRLDLLHQASLDGFDGDPQAFDRAVGQLDADALQVRTKLPLRDLGHVRADTAALLSDTFAMDDTALDGTPASDCTNSGHVGFPRLKRG